MNRWFQGNGLYRTLVLTFLAGIAAITVALANRNVYAKDAIDSKFEAVQMHEETRHQSQEWKIDRIAEDVQWLVRRQGGVPSAYAGEDNHTPQSD